MNAILIAITARPEVLAFRVNAGGAHGPGGGWVKGAPAGTADILACVAGRYVALEVKTDAGRQSPAQRKFEAAVGRAGGVYAVVRSVAEAEAVVGRAGA